MQKIQIFELKEVDGATVDILSQLMLQLVGEKVELSINHIESVIKSDNSHLFLVKDGDNIIGTFSLVVLVVPTGLKASVEDVVVDVFSRGRGIGEYMLRFAIEYARSKGISKLDLTSRPERISANTLYRKVGFQLRETNLYRIELI